MQIVITNNPLKGTDWGTPVVRCYAGCLNDAVVDGIVKNLSDRGIDKLIAALDEEKKKRETLHRLNISLYEIMQVAKANDIKFWNCDTGKQIDPDDVQFTIDR